MSTSPQAAEAGAPARAVVITGASSGIGRATALELGRRGFQVFAGVRKAADDAILERMPPQAMEIFVGRTAKAMALLSRFLPDRAFDAVVARAMS